MEALFCDTIHRLVDSVHIWHIAPSKWTSTLEMFTQNPFYRQEIPDTAPRNHLYSTPLFDSAVWISNFSLWLNFRHTQSNQQPEDSPPWSAFCHLKNTSLDTQLLPCKPLILLIWRVMTFAASDLIPVIRVPHTDPCLFEARRPLGGDGSFDLQRFDLIRPSWLTGTAAAAHRSPAEISGSVFFSYTWRSSTSWKCGNEVEENHFGVNSFLVGLFTSACFLLYACRTVRWSAVSLIWSGLGYSSLLLPLNPVPDSLKCKLFHFADFFLNLFLLTTV